MFKVTITETRTVEKDIGHKWVGYAHVPEVGYTPSHIAPTEETITRYEQIVDELDIQAVIRAVNQPLHRDSMTAREVEELMR